MIHAQSVKKYPILITALTNAATGTLGTFDCLGHSYAVIDLSISASNAASNVPSVAKLQEADVTNTSSFADVTGGSMTSAYTSANTSTSSMDVLSWQIDLRPRKRYLRVLVSPVTSQTVAGLVTLSRADKAEVPTAASLNAAAVLVL